MATGQYIKQNLLGSDIGTTEVRATLIPTTSYVATTAMDCRGYRQIDFFIRVDTVASITKLTVNPEAGHLIGSATEYASYLTETVSAGVATTNIYQIELNDPAPATNGLYKVSLPVEGRYVRLGLKSDSATGLVSVYATRRV
jgi:hypothetical protein